jgi:hypothetical protein
MLERNTKGKPAQQLVQLKEVRDGVMVLANNTLRSTLIVSSLNFALKSEEEQNAIIYAFQSFLNALDFPVQILIMSRKLDITPYLEDLETKKEKQQNDLLRLQMGEYINFITELVKGNNIMTKTFFVTVSFTVSQSKQLNAFQRITKSIASGASKNKNLPFSDTEFEHYKKQLMQRVEQVAVGLRSVGLRVAPLQTQEVLELFYNILNPITSKNLRLKNVSEISTEETELKDILSKQTHEKPWAGK